MANPSTSLPQPLPDGSPEPTRVRYGMLGLLCGLSMITYFDRVCFGAAASRMAEDLGLSSKEQLKWAHTAFAIAYGAFEIPAGWLADRWGPRGTLLRIVIWWSLFTALTGMVGLKLGSVTLGGLSLLIAVRFLFGAGEAGAYPNAARAIHNWFPIERWEMAQGFVFMAGRIAGGTTPLIWAILVSGTPYTAPLVHWRGAFVLFGGVGLIWCYLFARWFRDRPADHRGVNAAELELIGSTWMPQNHSSVPIRAMLKSRSLWAICLMYSLLNYGWFFNISYLPGYLKERFHLSDGDLVGAVYTGSPLWVGAVGCVAGGMIVNRLTRALGDRRRARQVVGSGATLVCAVAGLGVYNATSLHTFSVLISLAAFCSDLTLGAAWATCQDMGRKHAAVTAACMNTVGTGGAALAALLTGAIVEHFVRQSAVALHVTTLSDVEKLAASHAGYQAVFVTYAAVYLVASLCWCFVNASRPFDADEPTPNPE